MSVVEEASPGVGNVRKKFQMLEDSGYAQRLWDKELKELSESNAEEHKIAHVDIGLAKQLQTKELQHYRAAKQRRQEELRQLEDTDQQCAADLDQKLQLDEAKRKQQLEEDSRLARQASLSEEQAVRERQRKKEGLSLRTAQQSSESGGRGTGEQAQKSKYSHWEKPASPQLQALQRPRYIHNPASPQLPRSNSGRGSPRPLASSPGNSPLSPHRKAPFSPALMSVATQPPPSSPVPPSPPSSPVLPSFSQPPPEGHPFNPNSPVCSFGTSRWMTGEAPLPSAMVSPDLPQPKLAYKRVDSRKGKRK